MTHYRVGTLGGDAPGSLSGLVQDRSDPEVLRDIRAATNGNYALGSRRFQAEVAAMLGRRVTRGHAGRPPKEPPASANEDLFD
ncbi:MAG: hypothetical protein ACREYC_27400 [Gammaproteobacteria bacterium]